MTREELLKLGIYAPTRFSEQIELRLKLGQKVLFKYPVTPSKYRTILISIGHSNAPLYYSRLGRSASISI